jgi:N-acetylmuramoyl-L-alanine amidase
MTALIDLPDRVVLALLVYGESRGEPLLGQIAVACVVRNRLKLAVNTAPRWRDVCLAPKQFSCFNKDDANYPTVLLAADILMTRPLASDLQQALWIADGIISGACQDVTAGSVNYLTTQLLESKPPSWARNKPINVVIGHHSFLTA